MSTFDEAVDFALEWETGGDPEGGYTQDPADPGGETRWGISKRAHPELNVAELDREAAVEVYRRHYWRPTGARLAELEGADDLALALFDFAVNSGPERAVAALQNLTGAASDGILGPKSRAAIRRRAFELLALELCQERREYLRRIVDRRPASSRFLHGWLRRVRSLETRIYEARVLPRASRSG